MYSRQWKVINHSDATLGITFWATVETFTRKYGTDLKPIKNIFLMVKS